MIDTEVDVELIEQVADEVDVVAVGRGAAIQYGVVPSSRPEGATPMKSCRGAMSAKPVMAGTVEIADR